MFCVSNNMDALPVSQPCQRQWQSLSDKKQEGGTMKIPPRCVNNLFSHVKTLKRHLVSSPATHHPLRWL